MNRTDQTRHNESPASRVKELWEMGWSLRRIAAQLQADGVPSPRRGAGWTHTAVKRILERARLANNPAPETPSPPEPQAIPAADLEPSARAVGVIGPVTVTTSGPVTITADGPVTASGPVTITAGGPQRKDSLIELAWPASGLAGPPWPRLHHPPPLRAAREIVHELAHPIFGARGGLEPFFLRRRV